MQNNAVSLTQIFDGINVTFVTVGSLNTVNDIRINSKQIMTGNMFIAIEGEKTDGHRYLRDAYDRGAKFFVINSNKMPLPELSSFSNVTIIKVANTRECLSQIINNFYSNPSEKFRLIGVTGTNGKTSITTIAYQLFMKLGLKSGLIGTIDNYINTTKLKIAKTNPTTPDCVELGEIMDLFVHENIDVALMEVTSMALKKHRVDKCKFDIAVFTNLSPEHLDNHKTMEDYVNSKLLLFDMADKAIINIDDPYSDQVLKRCHGEILHYGIKNPDRCDIYAKDINYTYDSVHCKVVYQGQCFPLVISTPSEFAIYNNLAAIAICLMSGTPIGKIMEALQEEIQIEGRYDVIKAKQPFTAIVDYAHTPAALENLLKAVRKNESNRRIITVFGCGGDRDTSKRSIMGTISQQLSDLTIVTSDNPRTEKPESIIEDILSGMDSSNKNYITIVDRKEAIEYAVEIAHTDDVVIVAGKGHEKVQIFNGFTIDFDDKKVLLNAIHDHEFGSVHSFV